MSFHPAGQVCNYNCCESYEEKVPSAFNRAPNIDWQAALRDSLWEEVIDDKDLKEELGKQGRAPWVPGERRLALWRSVKVG